MCHSDVIGSFIWELHEMLQRRTNETSWVRTTETLLGVSLEPCLRCHGDVPLRRLGNVPLRHRWVFHLRLV